MLAIYKKELKSAFHNVVGWLFIAAILCIIGLNFFRYNLVNGLPGFHYAVFYGMFILIMAFPVITMRTIAEEQRTKTDQLLLTAPVSVGKIVIGKYLALLTIFTIPVLISCLFPLYLRRFGEVSMGESYVAILGLYLYGAAYLALGVFLSSLTENIVIAAVLSIAFNLLGCRISGIADTLFQNTEWVKSLISYIDTATPFSNLMNGCIHLSAVVYFISFCLLFLYLTVCRIKKKRYSATKENFATSVYGIAGVLVAVAIFIIANYGIKLLPASYETIDFTSKKMYSLTKDSITFAKAIEKEVSVYVLNTKESCDGQVDATLNLFTDLNHNIKVTYVDPALNSNFWKDYTETAPSLNSLIFVSDGVSKCVDYQDLYETTIDYQTYQSQKTGYDGEGQIASALSYVVNDERVVVYAISGHEEESIGENFKKAASKANVTISDLSLTVVDSVPEDAQALILNAPVKDYNEEDAQKVIDYVEKGGNLIVTTNIQAESLPNFEKILNCFEVSVLQGQVLEFRRENLLNQTYNCILPEMSYDSAIASFYSNSASYVFLPYAQAAVFPEETGENLTITPFLKTSDQAVNKADINSTKYKEMEEGDAKGPFSLGLRADKKGNDGETATMYLFTSFYTLSDQADLMVADQNSKMFSGVLKEVTELSNSIYIPVKNYDLTYLQVNLMDSILVFAVCVVLIPVILLICGVVVWAKRRRM